MRGLAWLFSVLFHPLFIFLYLTIIIIGFDPYAFGVAHWLEKGELILQVGIFTAFMPTLLVLLLKAVGFVDSIVLENQKERIVPYAFTGLLYLWLYQNLLVNPDIPYVLTTVLLGVILTVFFSFFINNFSKVSAHTAGMGGMVAALIGTFHFFGFHEYEVTIFGFSLNGLFFIILTIFLAGIVGSSRLVLGAHQPKEVFRGYFLGVFGQFLAFVYYFW